MNDSFVSIPMTGNHTAANRVKRFVPFAKIAINVTNVACATIATFVVYLAGGQTSANVLAFSANRVIKNFQKWMKSSMTSTMPTLVNLIRRDIINTFV